MTENLAIKWGKWVTERPLQTLLMVIAIALVVASGARHLSFNNDYRIFFDGDDPHLTAFENLQDTFTKNDNVLVAIAPANGDVFSAENLRAIADITDRAWQTPYSIRVDSLSNYQHTAAEEDDLQVGNLYEADDQLDNKQLEHIREIAINEPFLVHRLIAADSRVAAINITVEVPEAVATKAIPEIAESARELRDYIEQTYPGLKAYLTGIAMMNNAFPEAIQYDMSHLTPLAFILILLLVWLQLRGFSGTLATFFTILLSIASAMGVAGWAGIQLTPPAMSAPTIILTLAVADCVHLLSNAMHQRRLGKSRKGAIRESIRINFSPVLLTSVTTAIGFMSLNFSDAPPFRDLGNISAIGVMFAWFYSLTLLPALFSILPGREPKPHTLGSRLIARFGEGVIAKRNLIMPSMIILIIVLAACIPRNELNDVYVEYFDERIEFRNDTDFVVENLTGMYFIDYELKSGEAGGISKPEFLAQVDRFSHWLSEQPEVIHVNTLTDVFKRVNRSMHGDDDNWRKLPENRELAAQYLLLYEMSLPYGLDLNNQIDIDKQSTRLSATLKTISTKEVLAFEQRSNDWMQANTPSISTVGASPTVMFSHIGIRNIQSMLMGTAIALVAISILLVFAFNSFRYGLLSLIPNLAPAAMAFGLWGLIDGEIGLALSVVTAMTLGIVVDDTIHFMSKYLRAHRERGEGAIEAVRYAFSTVGIALWTTSLALVAGFLVLATSAFELNSGMGLLVSLVIALALFVDFTLLPALLIRYDHWLNKNPLNRAKNT